VESRPSVPPQFVILLPTLNEEAGVQATIRDIPFGELWDAGFDPQVLVVDGKSTDSTREVATSLGATVIPQTGRGKGAAVREGLEWAASRGAAYVAVMDADFTYPGSALPTMATLLAAGSDMVVGVRRPDRHAMSELRGLVHRVGNGVLNFLSGYLARGTILDVCSGLWGVRTTALSRLSLVSEGFDIEAEAFVKAFRLGLSVSQFPVVYRDRVGTAKLHAFHDGSRILLSILRYSRSPRGSKIGIDSSSLAEGPLPASTVRDLESVLFALNNRRVFVSAPAGQSAAVDGLVEQLRQSAPDLHVEIVPAASRRPTHSTKPPNQQGPAHMAGMGTPWSLVITLPKGPLRRHNQACTIHVPDGQRLLYIDLMSPETGQTAPPDPAGFGRSRAVRLEHSSDRRFSSLRFLSTSLAQFPGQRDLALIEANVGHSEYTVYRARHGRTPDLIGVEGPPGEPVLVQGDSTGVHGEE